MNIYLDIETIPATDPPPPPTAYADPPEDLGPVLRSVDSAKSLLSTGHYDGSLDTLEALEMERAKPRSGVLSAIKARRKAPLEAFQKWSGGALSPMDGKIVAVGYEVDDAESRARRAITQLLKGRDGRVERLGERLSALSPLGVLERGYAVVQSGDWVIQDSAELIEGQEISIRFARGEADARVEKVRAEKSSTSGKRVAKGSDL